MTEKLVAQVKRKLNVTWSDEETDARVHEIILSAIPTMKHKLGIADDTDFDFAEAGTENTLFLSYCLYEWNHCVNEFDANYANDLLQTRQKYEVAHFRATEVTADE